MKARAAAMQSADRIWRIGILLGTSPSPNRHVLDAFQQGLRELGYVQDQHLVFESRWADSNADRLPALAAELVRLRVDVIATAGVPAALPAKDATTTIPVVFMSVGEAVRVGLVASLARPGGNVTGVTAQVTELSGKWVELLKEIAPKVSRLGILWDDRNRAAALYAHEAEGAARLLGLPVLTVSVRSPGEFEGAFSVMAKAQVSGLVMAPGAMFFGERRRLAALAAKHRLPTVAGQREYAEAGGLIAYGTNLADEFRRAAAFVHKILRGAKPDDLPVEQSTKFELVINLKTAKALSLTVPPSLLLRADQVIE